ncbi:MAG: hypothetical protein HC851_06210 [Acaryochloris sp. RU_4_1]|nr:hypothetical protein [Acaryochloris sp. SU_5_25]NJM65282.1 hypothetical protein [Acaryochloris sp. RU_4_1]NJR54846.1 hypothetical protein [Acaryochloris sp. CRU_2_0]
MHLEFVPVEEFYFAITLCVRTLTDIENTELVVQMQEKLAVTYGQSSTVAAAQQNTFNYVFRVNDVDCVPADDLIVSIADWNGALRLSSDYGWILDENRKPKRTEKFPQRDEFLQQLKTHLQENFQVALNELTLL